MSLMLLESSLAVKLLAAGSVPRHVAQIAVERRLLVRVLAVAHLPHLSKVTVRFCGNAGASSSWPRRYCRIMQSYCAVWLEDLVLQISAWF